MKRIMMIGPNIGRMLGAAMGVALPVILLVAVFMLSHLALWGTGVMPGLVRWISLLGR